MNVYSWDASSQKIVKNSGSAPFVPAIGNIDGKKLGDSLGIDNEMLVSSAQVDTEVLKSWADACKMIN